MQLLGAGLAVHVHQELHRRHIAHLRMDERRPRGWLVLVLVLGTSWGRRRGDDGGVAQGLVAEASAEGLRVYDARDGELVAAHVHLHALHALAPQDAPPHPPGATGAMKLHAQDHRCRWRRHLLFFLAPCICCCCSFLLLLCRRCYFFHLLRILLLAALLLVVVELNLLAHGDRIRRSSSDLLLLLRRAS